MTFESPIILVLLLLIPLALYLKFKTSYFSGGQVKVSSLNLIKMAQKPSQTIWSHLPFVLTVIGLTFFILTLARPQLHYKRISHSIEGIEIILAMDISISMWFLDDEIGAMKRVGLDNSFNRYVYTDSTRSLKQRIHIAKKVIAEFIGKRSTDKIGLVAFKRRAVTLTPPTMKQSYLKNLVKRLNLSMIRDNGTAIGDALGSSINALKYSKTKNKIIILITDGNDNQEGRNDYPEDQENPPYILRQLEAAQLASERNIKIYTIGMGGSGRVFSPQNLLERPILPYEDYEKSIYFIEYGSEQINDRYLRKISQMTGGEFYRANNEAQLQTIYARIDELEKSEFDERFIIEKNEIYQYFLYPALFILALGVGLKYTVFRVLP